MMRAVFMVAAAAALLATPVSAQVGGGGRNRDPSPPKTEPTKPKIDEKAYKAALERIPDPKEKYDPWGGVAPAAPAKKPK